MRWSEIKKNIRRGLISTFCIGAVKGVYETASIAFFVVVPIMTTQLRPVPNFFFHPEKSDSLPTPGDILELEVLVDDPSLQEAEPEFLEKIKNENPFPILKDKKEIGRVLRFRKEGSRPVLSITSYQAGELEIPSFEFLKNGKVVFKTQPQKAKFSSVGGDKSQDTIYEPTSVSIPDWVFIVLAVISLGLVLLAIYFFEKWRRKRKKQIEAFLAAPKILTPIEEFEKTKNEICSKKYIKAGIYKKHYFGLSEASKRFLGKRFHFDAEERTTRELIQELKNTSISNQIVDQWKEIFEEMDVVKFTDHIPENSQAESLDQRLSRLVERSNS